MKKWGMGVTRQRLSRLSIGTAVLLTAFAACFGSLAPTMAQPAPEAAPQAPAVPVTVGTVTRQDVPLWLRGLGTVQAFYSVQLRPKVDGTLLEVPVTEGQLVKQGELLAVIDPKPYQAVLDAAMAKKGQDQAQLSNAQADLARYADLVRKDFASRQQVDTQQAMVKQYQAAIAGDEAQIEAAQLNLSYCYITAPFQGRVGLRTIDPGNFVRSAEASSLMPLSQIQPIAVFFTLPQDSLPKISDAMARGGPEVLAYASDDKTVLGRGTLLTVDNMIDSTTGTIRLKAMFLNLNTRLWPGQFVNARLLVDVDKGVLTVPSPAVQRGPSGLYVYVVGTNSVVDRVTVEVSRDDGTNAIVVSGLNEGQVVVTGGHSRLQMGTRVAVSDKTPSNAGSDKVGG
jgi:membrane fusion protein, multidrug efflux system